MDDELACLTGRLILEFGALEREIYHSIEMLQNMRGLLGNPDSRQVDSLWNRRLAHLRQLFGELSGSQPEFMGRYDKLHKKLRQHERQRGRLSHGIITRTGDRIIVYDRKSMSRSGDPRERINLSKEQLIDLPSAIVDARQELFGFRNEVQHLCRLK